TSSGNTSDDAAVAESVIGSSASSLVNGGVLTVTGTVNINAVNLVTVTTLANGTAGGFAPSAKGGTLGSTVVSGDTEAKITNGTVRGADVNLSATSNRTITTTAVATQGGSTFNPVANKTQQALSNNKAKTADGDVNTAAAVAVTILTGDT